MQFLANGKADIYTVKWDSEQVHYHRITPVTITASATTLAYDGHTHLQRTTRIITDTSELAVDTNSGSYATNS